MTNHNSKLKLVKRLILLISNNKNIKINEAKTKNVTKNNKIGTVCNVNS